MKDIRCCRCNNDCDIKNIVWIAKCEKNQPWADNEAVKTFLESSIIEAGADYLLSVKDNQKTLKEDIEDYVQDDVLRK